MAQYGIFPRGTVIVTNDPRRDPVMWVIKDASSDEYIVLKADDHGRPTENGRWILRDRVNDYKNGYSVIKCGDHPRYRGKRSPKVACAGCAALYGAITAATA